MRLKIGDTNWKMKVLTPESYIKTLGDEYKDTCGLTDTDKHIIYFRFDEIDISYVYHELFHSYFSLTLTHDSNMLKDDVEELSANIVGKHGDALITNGKKVYAWLLKRKKVKYNE